MNQLTRRDFLRLCSTAALAVGGSNLLFPIAVEAVKAAKQPVFWVQGSGCAGCSSSMLNTVDPGVREFLEEIGNLNYHPGITQLQGLRSLEQHFSFARKNRGNFILVVEGAIPQVAGGRVFTVGFDGSGKPFPLLDYIRELGRLAKHIVALGSCASFGGLMAAEPNPLEVSGLDKILSQNKVINLPGCPPHPDWVVGTLAHLALYGVPEMDDFGRPKVFYGGLIHNNCPRRQYFDNSIFATNFGEEGCLLELGCKGPLAHGDCPTRLWNKGTSWCVHSGTPCIGCTEPLFPNLTMPFYKKMGRVDLPGINSTADAVGITAGIATGVGLAIHFAGTAIKGRLASKERSAGWAEKEGEKRDA